MFLSHTLSICFSIERWNTVIHRTILWEGWKDPAKDKRRPCLKTDEAARMGIWTLLCLVLIKALLFILALGVPALEAGFVKNMATLT